MKSHKHRDLIIAWANGAQIQKLYARDDFETWDDEENPTWSSSATYRIKPREFKEGAWYPIQCASDQVGVHGDRLVSRYVAGLFQFNENTNAYHEVCPSDIYWIGEPLEINWPESE